MNKVSRSDFLRENKTQDGLNKILLQRLFHPQLTVTENVNFSGRFELKTKRTTTSARRELSQPTKPQTRCSLKFPSRSGIISRCCSPKIRVSVNGIRDHDSQRCSLCTQIREDARTNLTSTTFLRWRISPLGPARREFSKVNRFIVRTTGILLIARILPLLRLIPPRLVNSSSIFSRLNANRFSDRDSLHGPPSEI